MATSGLLRDQLYRYAEELQTLMQSHGELEQRFRRLSELHRSAIEGHSSLEGFIQLSQDIHLLTDCAGMISQCNPAAAAALFSATSVTMAPQLCRMSSPAASTGVMFCNDAPISPRCTRPLAFSCS